jgi:hypothetical protein
MKKILSLFIGLGLSFNLVNGAQAANPKSIFTMDCNTQEKQVSMGYQSDPANPTNGPEIIALKFTYRFTPNGTATFDDIKDVSLQVNPSYGSFVTAENNRTVVGNTVEIKFAGGFTGGTGAAQAADLIFVKGINQKEYVINVITGELYPKNSTTNIYQNSNETFIANPSICTQTTTETTNTTNTTTTTTTTETTETNETTLTLTSDKASAKAGDVVEVTALIKNRKGLPISWSQTGGAQIIPEIANEELPNNETKSVLKFTMVESTQNIILRLAIGAVTEGITIQTESTTQATTNSAEVGEDGLTLQERLQQRRDELNAQANPTTTTNTPGNVHAAAGSLSQSGPAETSLFILVSAMVVVLWRRLKRSEVDINV